MFRLCYLGKNIYFKGNNSIANKYDPKMQLKKINIPFLLGVQKESPKAVTEGIYFMDKGSPEGIFLLSHGSML